MGEVNTAEHGPTMTALDELRQQVGELQAPSTSTTHLQAPNPPYRPPQAAGFHQLLGLAAPPATGREAAQAAAQFSRLLLSTVR